MTPEERHNILCILDMLLRDNVGNRMTPALIVGIVNTLHDQIPVEPPTPTTQGAST